jgi:alpha-L-rhamnosidase
MHAKNRQKPVESMSERPIKTKVEAKFSASLPRRLTRSSRAIQYQDEAIHMTSRIFLALSIAAPLWAAGISDVKQGFLNPPDDARIMMRWWWFGSAVTRPELEKEMLQMKQGGIGGFEVQPVYPLALDDPETGFRNLPYLSGDYLDTLKFAAEKARELGLRIDITLGSGWPFGGPHIPITEAAGKLRADRVPIPANAVSIPVPAIGDGEKLIAGFIGMTQVKDIRDGRLYLPKNLGGSKQAIFFISSRTGMQVKRPAVGAEGFVLDHYDRKAIEAHLSYTGEHLLQAFGTHPPTAIFSDSLELFGSDWTPDFLEEFRKRRGYDLTPYLPALVTDIGEKTAQIRHDWGQTLTELGDDNYLTPIREWARKHGTKFRSQTYGTPPAVLSSNALVDLPEGEAGPKWRVFSTARWAVSASHLYNRPVTSSETWTWLHSPAFRATPLDMKAEADLHFLQGINQLVGHGWPYSPDSAGEPGWRFYAAAVFNAHNPWWLVMPDIAKYFQRVSYLMRQGKPANDVALYLPTDDAWAGFTLGKDSVDRSMEEMLGPAVLPQILDAGYNLDFIDDRAIESVGIPYPVLVVPDVKRMPPATAAKLEAYAKKGGIVIHTDREAVGLGKQIGAKLQPDFASVAEVGFTHRKLDDGELYFVANTSNHAVHTMAIARVKGLEPEWWDPFTAQPIGVKQEDDRIALDLEPYESRILVYSKAKSAAPLPPTPKRTADISTDWTVNFPAAPEHMSRLQSWTDDEETRYFSGKAVYEKKIDVSDTHVMLDLGKGTPVEDPGSRGPGMRALLESPVREAAQVFVNGKPAGYIWRPPYRLDISKVVQPGSNVLEIIVGNLAINRMAGEAQPDYKLLNLRFGERFQPQDMKDLQPLPSGLLGPVQLIYF